ncbi:peptidoglycan-binding protein [Paracoccus sp. p3-h83]|uniref:peptidoglycan recognition protein family protein n=1 Tax=Paracoccus sp. p3-h83 TaxID=3342805 RepID=UPI0035B6DC13
MTYYFKKPARSVDRVFLHCSASDNPAHDSAAVMDAWHKECGWAGIGYHFFIRKDGTLELGRDLEKTPAAQEGNNTGTIAICLHGLDEAKFTKAQFDTLRVVCAQIHRAYGGRVTFHGHKEVARKDCPVFDYAAVLDLEEGRLPDATADSAHIPTVSVPVGGLEVPKSTSAVLSLGSKGNLVRDLQRSLENLGYFTGAIDGDFGRRTRDAVMAFQADNHLEADGKFGTLSREAMAQAPARPVVAARAFASLGDLAEAGSRIVRSSRRNMIVGGLIGSGGLATVIDEVTGQADMIQRLFEQHGLLTGGVILIAGAFVAWQSWRAAQARVEDHRTGKTA